MNHNTNNVEITLDYRVIPVGGARDIRGKKFGRITILERIERPNRFTSASGLTYWLGECECGDVGDYVGGDLTRGHTKSCGCMRNEITSKRRRSNLVGKVYGRLKVKKLIGSNKLKKLVYLCVCSCGKKTKVVAEDIISGHTQSCGCIRSEVASKMMKKRYFSLLRTNETSASYTGRKLHSKEIYHWRNKVFKRDDYACQLCNNRGGTLNAHHLNAWNAYPDERFDIDNGITLCTDCHTNFHKEYGYGNNTKEQFSEFRGTILQDQLSLF